MDKKIVFVLSEDDNLLKTIKEMLDRTFSVSIFSKTEKAFNHIYNNLPDLIIVHIRHDNEKRIQLFNELKSDPIFSRIPLLVVLPEWMEIDWDMFFAEDYIYESCLQKEIKKRANLAIIRTEKVVEINPLTRLPGNISINKEIQKRIDRKEVFALAYLDIDQFKPFNDKYGFSRGDEVIKAVGRLILNFVKAKEPKTAFIGHIGGDDFIYIVNPLFIEEISEEVITNFNRLVPIFYDKDDVEQGCIKSKDRQGIERQFPIMSVSIGIAHNRFVPFSHYGEVTEIAAKMKSIAKQNKGGCWVIDRRQR